MLFKHQHLSFCTNLYFSLVTGQLLHFLFSSVSTISNCLYWAYVFGLNYSMYLSLTSFIIYIIIYFWKINTFFIGSCFFTFLLLKIYIFFRFFFRFISIIFFTFIPIISYEIILCYFFYLFLNFLSIYKSSYF